MALKQHRSHYRVKFFDDSQDSVVDYNSSSYATQVTRTQHDGPRFPNLQLLFKSRQAAEEDRTVVNRSVETVEMRKEKKVEEKVEDKVAEKEGNVDMDAGEYIKRRHQNYLQRIASMNA